MAPTPDASAPNEFPLPCPKPGSTAPRSGARAGGFRRAAAGAVVALAVFAAIAFAAVTVIPWGPPVVDWFDPKSPPPDLGPDGGDCFGKFAWSGGAPEGRWVRADSVYTVESLADITVMGYSDIRLPDDADTVLVGHENGHDRLNAYEYGKRAKKKIGAAARTMIGRKFKGVGATDSIRFLDATEKAIAARDSALRVAKLSVGWQMKFLSELFDLLTKHGTSGTCTTAEAEAIAKGKYEKAPPAGETQKTEDPSKQKGKGAPADKFIFIDPERLLAFSGPGTIVETTNPADPILGRGRVMLEPFGVIGLQENGSMLLSDTRLLIMDAPTGDTLLVGFVLEAACVTTDIPGQEGMVQGYLAIPPLWAGGVRNTIGSEFLAAMAVASETDEETTLWLRAPLPLFDSTGACLIPLEGIPAIFTIGFGWPPTSAVRDVPGPRPGLLGVSPQPGTGAVRFAWAPLRGAVRLELFDVLGARRRAVTADGTRGAWVWDGADDQGQALPAGIYFAHLKGPGIDLKSRVVRLR